MTGALATEFPGAVVDTVELGDVDDGTTSRTRARLTYRAGSGPASVFIKAQGRLDHRLVLAAIRGLRPEAWLFAAGEDLPLEVPKSYAGAVDAARLDTVVVIEDITARGGLPNVATEPLSPEQVADGLAGLARLHARYWDRPLPPALDFVRPWTLVSGWTPIALAGASRGVRRLRASGQEYLLPEPLRSGARLLWGFARYSALVNSGPVTLLHGDAHVGNTYALTPGRVGFYDWQLVRTGCWAHDVGYFIVSALGIDDRRRHQRELVEGYLASLSAAGAPAPHFAAGWLRFRQTPIYGLSIFLQTLAMGDYQSDAVSETCIARFAAAYDDLDTGQAIGIGQ
jgi:hypothetical protein